MANWYIPTTKVTILRGTTETEYGDVVPSDTKVYTGIPAVVALSATQDLATGTRAVIRDKYAALVPKGTDIRAGDIVLDEYLGTKYSVLDVVDHQPTGPFRNAPITATLTLMEI
jgi:hypothetical protein